MLSPTSPFFAYVLQILKSLISHIEDPNAQPQGGKGDLIWQLSCIYETITTKILKKIINFFIEFLELLDKNNF